MKKKLTTLLLAGALVLGSGAVVLSTAACNGGGETKTACKVDDLDEAAKKDIGDLAIAQVGVAYTKFASDGISTNQSLVTSTNVKKGKCTYSVTLVYSVASEYAEMLSINAAGDKLIGKFSAEEQQRAKFHVVAKLGDEEIASKDFNVLLLKVTTLTLEAAYDKKDGETFKFKAFVTHIYANAGETTGGAIFVGSGDYGAELYFKDGVKRAGPEDLKVGDAVEVNMTLKWYNGIFENDSSAAITINKLGADEAEDIEPANVIAIDAEHQIDLTGRMGSRPLTMTGAMVLACTPGEYKGAPTINADLKVGEKVYSVYVDGRYALDGVNSWKKTREGATEATTIEAGDIISIKGLSSMASADKPQVLAGEVTAWEEGDGAPQITEPDPVSMTVAEVLALGETSKTDALIRVSGILEGLSHTDKYGNGFLGDPNTGASLKLYGMTKERTAFTYSVVNGYKFSNPLTAVEGLADVNNGETVTVLCTYSGDYKNASAVLEGHEATVGKFSVSKKATTNGEFSVSKESVDYGEEVVVTPTPATGYKVKSVKVNHGYATPAVTATDGVYKFNATSWNEVEVVFEADEGGGGGEQTTKGMTQDNPFTAAEFGAWMETVTLNANNVWADQEVFVTGKVTKSTYDESHTSYSIWIEKAGEADVEVYSGQLAAGVTEDAAWHTADALVGKTIVAKGYAQKYTNKSGAVTYELAYLSASKSPTGSAVSPSVLSITDGEGGEGGGGGEQSTKGMVETDPFSAAEFGAWMETVTLNANNVWPDQEVFITGTITKSTYDSGHTSYSIWIEKAGEADVEVYSGQLAAGVTDQEAWHTADALVGKKLLAKGYAQKYTNKSGAVTYELAYLSASKSPTGAAVSPQVLSIKDAA